MKILIRAKKCLLGKSNKKTLFNYIRLSEGENLMQLYFFSGEEEWKRMYSTAHSKLRNTFIIQEKKKSYNKKVVRNYWKFISPSTFPLNSVERCGFWGNPKSNIFFEHSTDVHFAATEEYVCWNFFLLLCSIQGFSISVSGKKSWRILHSTVTDGKYVVLFLQISVFIFHLLKENNLTTPTTL